MVTTTTITTLATEEDNFTVYRICHRLNTFERKRQTLFCFVWHCSNKMWLFSSKCNVAIYVNRQKSGYGKIYRIQTMEWIPRNPYNECDVIWIDLLLLKIKIHSRNETSSSFIHFTWMAFCASSTNALRKTRYNPKAIQTHTGIKLKIRSRKLKTFHVEWASDMWILSSILLNFVVFLNGMWNGFVQWVERKRECPTRYPASHRRWCGKRACETVNKWGNTGICEYIPVTRVRQT